LRSSQPKITITVETTTSEVAVLLARGAISEMQIGDVAALFRDWDEDAIDALIKLLKIWRDV
jgi:hypothetical protein